LPGVPNRVSVFVVSCSQRSASNKPVMCLEAVCGTTVLALMTCYHINVGNPTLCAALWCGAANGGLLAEVNIDTGSLCGLCWCILRIQAPAGPSCNVLMAAVACPII
jgi:hypothetical protein